jgi:hypothetical protein
MRIKKISAEELVVARQRLFAVRKMRLRKLLGLNAPDVIIESAARLVLVSMAGGRWHALWRWVWYELRFSVEMAPWRARAFWWAVRGLSAEEIEARFDALDVK